MFDIGIEHVRLFDLPGHRRRRRVGLAHDHRRDVLESRIARNRTRLCTDELHAVVLLRIVTRRDHDAAAEAEMCRCEVDHLGAALPDVHDIAARLRESLCERIADRRSGQADVMSDGHLLRAEQRGETAPDAVGKLLVDLVRIDAAYVICAKTFVCHCHVTSPPPGMRPAALPLTPLSSDSTAAAHNKMLYNINTYSPSFSPFPVFSIKILRKFTLQLTCARMNPSQDVFTKVRGAL